MGTTSTGTSALLTTALELAFYRIARNLARVRGIVVRSAVGTFGRGL